MKVSYNWLKWYIPEAPEAEKLADVLTYHLAEVETVEKLPNGDFILDIKILPNRAHDLLSHQGMAREIASLLNITYVDPTSKYKVPESKATNFKVEIQNSKCRRHVGRVVRNVKISSSPEWMVKHLESIGQRSINNLVDATNIVMFDCGQPTHVFDMDKVVDTKIIIRSAKEGEKVTLLGGVDKIMASGQLILADGVGNPLDVAGIKGGTQAELTSETKNVILQGDNFDPTSIRKTAQYLNIFTDARKRFENDLSPELGPYAMLELSALIAEMCPEAVFEDIVDVYPEKQKEKKVNFSSKRISSILGLEVSSEDIEDILKRYNFRYKNNGGVFELTVPFMRLDLETEEDIAEEIGRVIGYDKLKAEIPKIDFKLKANEEYVKIQKTREDLLGKGYSEVMTYVFQDKGEVEVLASASDKKFLRTNLTSGLSESLKLNKLNAPLLGLKDIKIFEIGTVFLKGKEEMHVAYNEGEKIIEVTLDDFCEKLDNNSLTFLHPTGGTFRLQNSSPVFHMWSLFPFIVRDISVWLPEGEEQDKLKKLLLENATDLLVKEPYIVDSFVGKDGRTSYAFRLVFQSFERTLKDEEVNDIMTKISSKIKENSGWQVR